MVAEVVTQVGLALRVRPAQVEKAAFLRVAAELATEAMGRLLIQQPQGNMVLTEIGERTGILDL